MEEKNIIVANDSEENKAIQERLKEIMHNNLVVRVKNLIEQIEANDSSLDGKLIIGNICGATPESVAKWQEPKGRNPQLWTLLPLTNLLGCSIDELLRGFELTDKDIKELEELGLSKESAMQTIEYYSNEKIEDRANQNVVYKMGLEPNKYKKILNLKNVTQERYLFGGEDLIKKVKYSKLLNYTIENDIINHTFNIYIDEIRTNIRDYINKQYKGMEDKIKLKNYRNEIAVDKNRLDTETIYQNIKSSLNIKEITNIEEKLQKEVEHFIHKAVIDLLFPLDDNK